LKIEKTIEADHQAKLTVEFEAEILEAYRRQAARKMAERGKIPGFRPGKAPYDVIVRNYGEAAITEQAVDLLVETEYSKILKEADISPGASGTLESVDALEPPRLTFKVPLAPEVDLGKYQSIRLPYKWKVPSQVEVDEAIEELRRVHATTETVERPLGEGDYGLVDLQSAEAALTRNGLAVYVRQSDRKDEWPFLGFARKLIGMKTGETRTLAHKYDKDHADEGLRGKSLEIAVTLKTVRSVSLPDLNDEFAKTTGIADTLEAMKESVKKEVEARSRAEYDDEYYVELIEKIKAQSTIKYSAHALEHEAHHVLEELARRLAQQGMDLPAYYKVRGTDAEKFLEDEAKPVARKRLERSLILEEIIRKENIELDREQLQQEFGSTVNNLSAQGVDFAKIRGGRQGQQRVAEALATESASRLMTKRALEILKEIATGTYKPRTAAEHAPKAEAPASPDKTD
jgi:trigger factor